MANEFVNHSGALVQTDSGLGIAVFRFQGTLCVALLARTRCGAPTMKYLENPGQEFRLPLGYNVATEVKRIRGLVDEAHRWQLRTFGKLPVGTLVDVMA